MRSRPAGLGNQVKALALELMPTPKAWDGEMGRPRTSGRPIEKSTHLGTIVTLLPTPNACDGSGGRLNSAGHQRTLPGSVADLDLLPTPRAARGGSGTETMYELGGERDDSDRPQGEVLLPTPRAAAGRTSRGAAVRSSKRSSPSLEQSMEIARGELPRELASWEEAPASWLPTPPASQYGSNRSPSPGAAVRPSLAGVASSDGEWGKYEPAIRRWEAATRPAPPATEPNRNGKPRLSAQFVEWMMGLPEGHVTAVPHVSRSMALKALGNGVCPQQAVAALGLLLGSEGWAA